MLVERFEDAAEFGRRAAPLLGADPAAHTVMLGVLRGIADGRYEEHRLWLVSLDGEPQAAVTRTPPFHLLLARPRTPAALAPLAARVRADDPGAGGVNGAMPEAEAFAAAWGPPWTVRMRMRLHSLRTATPVPAVAGHMRAATAADLPLLLAWMEAFAAEVGIQGSPEQHAASIRARLGEPEGIVLWEVGGTPVAFAGSSESSPGVGRIGPVYTPPDRRRNGYATALVHSLTEALLRRGVGLCLLYTDLANPTSNAIYARIGYRPVLDAVEIEFGTG
jgi:predicted GNAT family acetyltransferase